jgi:hypothetical protein
MNSYCTGLKRSMPCDNLTEMESSSNSSSVHWPSSSTLERKRPRLVSDGDSSHHPATAALEAALAQADQDDFFLSLEAFGPFCYYSMMPTILEATSSIHQHKALNQQKQLQPPPPHARCSTTVKRTATVTDVNSLLARLSTTATLA